MRILRTLFVVALIFPAASLSVFPAAAAVDASVEFLYGQGASPWTPPAGSILRGSWLVVAEARASSSLKSFRVAIESVQDGHTVEPGGNVVRSYIAGTTSNARIELDWETGKLTRFNGEYRLVATATSQVDEATISIQQLKVDNYPQTPNGLAAKNTEGVSTLSWKANSEPDILFYRISRSVNGDPFTTVAEVKGVSFEDRQAPRGAELRYKLLAVRASVVNSAGISSGSTSPTPAISLPASSAGKSQLDATPPTQAQVQASAPTIVSPRRDLGYSPYLPYDEEALENSESSSEEPSLLGAPDIFRNATEGTAYKPIYTAAGLILFVAALHILRLALQLFGNPRAVPSPPILVR